MKLFLEQTKVYVPERCTCEYFGSALSSPRLIRLHTYRNSNYLRCSRCDAKRLKNESKRDCQSCGREMRKRNINNDGSFYYFCPECFPLVHELISESNIPPLFRRVLDTLNSDKPNRDALDDLKSIARDYSLIYRGSILLWGHTGCGKTSLACALGMELMKNHVLPVRYISVLRYLNHLKTLFYDYTERGKQKLQEQLSIRKAPILIMDDFNKEDYREGVERDTIYDIVDHRYSNRLFTIFTAQSKAFGGLPEQTASRILQMAEPYDLGSQNRRTRS